MEEKTYAVLTADSVNVMAEASGLSPIPQDAAASLGEDASYRMRQVIMLATQYMKHSKRKRLTVDDFNRAVKELSLMPVNGHGSQDPVTFRQVKDSDIHCVEDLEVNLVDVAMGNSLPKYLGEPSIKAHWLAVEGSHKVWTGSSSAPQAGKATKEMSKTHLSYYNCVTKALLSYKSDAKKKVLQDLKTNPNIVPVLPYLVNFLISGIKNMSHDTGHLTTMLNAIRALQHNRSLYLMHKPYLSTLVQGVEFCLLEPLAASISSTDDQWLLRDYAARLLAEIVNRWNSPQNHLRYNTIKCMRDVLYDTTKPFYSHYGAIMALIDLGHKAIEDVILPHLSTYWPHLTASMEDTSREMRIRKSDAHKVYGALRLAAEKTIRKHIRKFRDMATALKEKREVREKLDAEHHDIDFLTSGFAQAEEGQGMDSKDTNLNNMYKELQQYFGDSLACVLPLEECRHVWGGETLPQGDTVLLGDPHTQGKSGDQLLADLMEQIRREEAIEQERKERERIEKEEREKQERLKQAREAILQKKREEEEKAMRIKMEEEEERRRQYELMEIEHQRRLRQEEEKERERQRIWEEKERAKRRELDQLQRREWEEKEREINKNRSKPEFLQEIELRRQQLEEEMQYSRKMEAKKREADRQRLQEEQQRRQRQREVEEERTDTGDDEDGDSSAGRSLRRRKPVNYTEKDEDIADLFEEKPSIGPRPFPRLAPNMPPHSDISDVSDDETTKKLPDISGEDVAVSKVIDPSKGLLKLKIKRQAGTTPQHTPSSYHSPSMTSPIYSPLASHSTPPLPSAIQYRSKSSSGSEKESKHKRASTSSRQSWSGNAAIQDISDPDEPYEKPAYEKALFEKSLYDKTYGSSFPSQLYSPGGESSGSDSNPHRKALKLKLKLTPKDSTSEGEN